MLIDSLAIKLSGSSAMKTCGPGQAAIISTLYDTLRSIGWSLTNSLSASLTIKFPFGFPTTFIPSPLPVTLVPTTCGVVSLLIFDGMHYCTYDPYSESPLNGPNCTMVQLGLTSNATAANLVSAINGSPKWSASWNDPIFTIGAKLPGPDSNSAAAYPDGRWGAGNAITEGGGWGFTSIQDKDKDGFIRTTKYSFKVTGQSSHIPTFNSGGATYVNFEFDLNTGKSTHRLDTFDTYFDSSGTAHQTFSSFEQLEIKGYTLLANPYSFAMFDQSEDASQYSGFRSVSIFACAPYIPTEEGFTATISTNAVFIVGAQALRTTTFYSKGRTTTALDAPPSENSGSPWLLAMRSPGTTPLKSPSGAPMVTNSWVMMARNNLAIPQVVGKLWDCAMVNDMVTSGVMIDGKRYIRISQQDGIGGLTRSSLVFAVPTNTFVNPPADPPASETLPVENNSTGNVSSGGVVTSTSGLTFNIGMVGGTVTFTTGPGATVYTITGFTNDTTITTSYTGPGLIGIIINIFTTVTQPTGGGVVHHVSTYGTGSIGPGASFNTGQLVWLSGNYLFDDWMFGQTITIDGNTYTVTKIINDGALEFTLPPPSTKFLVSWSIGG